MQNLWILSQPVIWVSAYYTKLLHILCRIMPTSSLFRFTLRLLQQHQQQTTKNREGGKRLVCHKFNIWHGWHISQQCQLIITYSPTYSALHRRRWKGNVTNRRKIVLIFKHEWLLHDTLQLKTQTLHYLC